MNATATNIKTGAADTAAPGVEMCRCGFEVYRHGRHTVTGRQWSCDQLAATAAREEFTAVYAATPWWRRWLLRTPEGW